MYTCALQKKKTPCVFGVCVVCGCVCGWVGGRVGVGVCTPHWVKSVC
jgi:hypothetical protein